jgi:hypothetical protein
MSQILGEGDHRAHPDADEKMENMSDGWTDISDNQRLSG